MKKWQFMVMLVVVITMLSSLVLFGCGPKEVKWVMNSCENNHEQLGVIAWDELVEKVSQRTDGKFTISVVLDKEIGIAREQFSEALAEGSIHMAQVQSALAEALMPHLGIFSLPYFTITQEDCLKVASAVEYITLARMEELGYRPVTPESIWCFSPQEVIVKEPIKDLNDLAGLKIRVWRTGDAALLQALGAEPVYMSFSEVYMALQRGVIDGVNTSAEGMLTASLFEGAKHYYGIHFPRSICYDVVSIQHWEALPDDYKKILQEEARVAADKIRNEYEGVVAKSVNGLGDKGVTIHELSAEDRKAWRAVAESLWEEWAKANPINQEAYEAAKKALGL